MQLLFLNEAMGFIKHVSFSITAILLTNCVGVVEGFMAQTGDVEFGKAGGNISMAGRGGSDLPDLPAEFSDTPYDRGVIGMARAQNPNSANSQFFIMFAEGYFLNGQYTVVGKVTDGMDVVDAIKLGKGANGAVLGIPDRMSKVTVTD